MIALLQKDWRLNRAPVIASLIVLLGPYVLGGMGLAYALHQHERWNAGDVAQGLEVASAISTFLLIVLASAYGGVAFAQERQERSSDFLAMLPTDRIKILTSKVLVAAGCIGLPIVMNLVVFDCSERLLLHTIGSPIELNRGLPVITGLTLMLFGLGWLCSSFLSSPAIAAAIAIGASGVLFVAGEMFAEIQAIPEPRLLHFAAPSFILIGLICVIAGGAYWLRRVEP